MALNLAFTNLSLLHMIDLKCFCGQEKDKHQT